MKGLVKILPALSFIEPYSLLVSHSFYIYPFKFIYKNYKALRGSMICHNFCIDKHFVVVCFQFLRHFTDR